MRERSSVMIEDPSGKHTRITEPHYFYDDQSERRSLLRRAAINGNPRVLLEQMRNVPPQKRSLEFGIALFDALESGVLCDVIIKELIAGGADLQVCRQFDKSTRTGRILNHETALMRALRHRDVDLTLVKTLVDAGASVHAEDAQGHTVLSIAVHHADAETVAYLMEMGASWQRYDHNDKSVLSHACKPGYHAPEEQVKIVEALLKKGALEDLRQYSTSRERSGYTPLMFAVDCRSRKFPRAAVNLDLVRLLMAYGADPAAEAAAGSMSALALAEAAGHQEVLQIFRKQDDKHKPGKTSLLGKLLPGKSQRAEDGHKPRRFGR